AEPETHPDGDIRCRIALELARGSGKEGMVGGQMIDIYAEQKDFDLAGVTQLQRLKTGALIRFSALAGGIVGGADDSQIGALSAYAEDLGLAFQIVDDILDATEDAETLGKPAGQDAEMDKATFIKLLGMDGAKSKASDLVERCKSHLDPFGAAADPLKGAADFVFARKN
ncbi:MAG: polyprenyl synthetase family protein, partial [Pseudomonadota bacterium]